ncbi:MAG: response regulator [Nannocystaceae bacterium]|nr:response regulator [Nannocystaceae bacterium]
MHVETLIDEATALLRRALPSVVEIATEVGPRVHVMGDRTRLLQVLMNAGINAGHAMPTGGLLSFKVDQLIAGTRTDTGRAELTPGKYVRLRIEDTGAGMDSEVLEQVFQPFFSTKPEGEGTGLGMANAQSVVREHGGDIDIRSSKDVGSCVTVYLPAAEPSQADEPEELDALMPLTGRVLVADNELLVRSTARRLLRGYGLQVDVAADGHEALETLLASSFDLAIVADDLSGVAAERVVGLVAPRMPKTRFVIASSRSQSTRQGLLEEAGIAAFLDKPFDARTLYAAVAAALQGTRPAND